MTVARQPENALAEALEMLIAVAAQYLDTGRGDLDGAIDRARVALAAGGKVWGPERMRHDPERT